VRGDARLNLTRRKLFAGVSLLALATLVPTAQAQNATARTVFVALKGVDRLSDRETIEGLVNVFSANQIPVSLVLSDLSNRAALEGSALEKSLGQFSNLLLESSLVEFILPHRPHYTPHRYLHLRAATELKKQVATALNQLDAGTSAASFVSVYDLSADDVLEQYAYRSAGLRIQIRRDSDLENDNRTEVVAVDWGILKITGGIYRDAASDPQDVLEAVRATGQQQLVVIDFENSLDQSSAWLIARMREWANQLNSEIAGGGILAKRPKDYLLQGNPGATKSVALVFDVGASGHLAPQLAEFADLLDGLDVPYSLVSTRQTAITATEPRPCSIETSPAATAQIPDDSCVRLMDQRDRIGDDNPATIVLHSPHTEPGWIGPGSDARFHIYLKTFQPRGLFRAIRMDPFADGVELISIADVRSKFQQIVLAREVEKAQLEGRIHFVSLPELRDIITAPDEVVKRVWSIRRRGSIHQDVDEIRDVVDRTTFLEDARIAWQFLELHTHDATGLCAGTVMGTGNTKVVNNEVTLWDVGSQIQGIIGALNLGIVDMQKARTATTKILENIPLFKSGDFQLPFASFDAKTLAPVLVGFDASDTGRFLIALQSAVLAGLVNDTDAKSLLSSWDLAAAVRDGHAHSFSKSRWVDTFASHSTHYIRHGFAFAGMDIETPYPTLPKAPTGDDLVRLLYQAALLGHYGAEPGLLEVVEGLQSAENQYLAQVLFDAQLRYFDRTGKIRCVSETPIGFSPWFIYQGLRVDLPDESEWVVASGGAGKLSGSLDDPTSYRMISSKAAFLWAATFPHPHTTRLLSLVRNRGRIDGLGYASGLSEETHEQMAGYSDVNTNGIILSAVSKILS
jgi:hypothetical protein